jgi:hypothetical protein
MIFQWIIGNAILNQQALLSQQRKRFQQKEHEFFVEQLKRKLAKFNLDHMPQRPEGKSGAGQTTRAVVHKHHAKAPLSQAEVTSMKMEAMEAAKQVGTAVICIIILILGQ